MSLPRIYADFQNADALGRLRLNNAGTLEDLKRQHIQLGPNLQVCFYTDDADAAGNPDDLQVVGVVAFSDDENVWVASIDWSAIRHQSEIRSADSQPVQPLPNLSSVNAGSETARI